MKMVLNNNTNYNDAKSKVKYWHIIFFEKISMIINLIQLVK